MKKRTILSGVVLFLTLASLMAVCYDLTQANRWGYLDDLEKTLNERMTYNREVVDWMNIHYGVEDYLQRGGTLTYNVMVDYKNIEHWIIEAN